MTDISFKRLRKEYRDINSEKGGLIRAAPLESNMLECHYVIQGAKGSPFAGGWYHGKLLFPPEYPYRPPGVVMCTPNGRFKVNTRLCLSLSDFHPESWNPMWSVSSILTGLQSFMEQNQSTSGSITSTYAEKRAFAAQSLDFNCRNKIFCELFPELVELNEEYKIKRQQVARNGGDGKTTSASDSLAPGPVGDQRDYAIDDAIDDAIRIMDVVLDLVINNKKTLVVIIVACILGSFLWIRFPS